MTFMGNMVDITVPPSPVGIVGQRMNRSPFPLLISIMSLTQISSILDCSLLFSFIYIVDDILKLGSRPCLLRASKPTQNLIGFLILTTSDNLRQNNSSMNGKGSDGSDGQA